MKTIFRFINKNLLLLLFVTIGNSQTKQLDSLRSILPALSGKERLEVLFTLSNKLEGIVPKDARDFGLEGVTLALKLGDSSSLATLYSSLAFSSSELGDFEQSLKFGYQSLDVSNLIHDKKKAASANSTLGIAYAYIGKYSKALEHHLEALRFREELHLTIPIAATLNNIGIVYHRIGQYDKAIDYYTRAMKIHGDSIPTLSKARFLTNIGYSEFKRGNIDVAMKYHNDALAIAERSNYIGVLAYIYFNFGIMHTERNEHATSLKYLLLSLEKYDALGQKYGSLQLLNAIGVNYFKTNKYEKAVHYLNRAIILGKQINAPDQLKVSYETMYSIYDRIGPISKAYSYYKLYFEANDLLLNSNESKKIAEIAIDHITLQKQREIEVLKNEKMISELSLEREELRTNILYGSVLLSLGLSVFLFFNYRRIQKHRLTVDEKNKALNSANDELTILNNELQAKVSEIKLLTGLLPICSSCKKIRDDKGEWERIEKYISTRSEAKFSHGICPDCMKELYGDVLSRYKP